jgi:tetratricopeptide (TPR) repeat protein
MTIDIYQPCPCHSGKKIKFCCGKDIVHELDQVLTFSNGKQFVAALDLLDRTIDKVGQRDCLLTLKTHILIKLGELDKAQLVNEQFLQSQPNHVLGFQHRAVINASRGELGAAVTALQDALDFTPGEELPFVLNNAFKIVGLALLSNGDVFAARAHLRYALQLRGEQDGEEINRILLESYRMPWASLLLKEDLRLAEPPEDAAWTEKFMLGIRMSYRAQWRQAIIKFDEIIAAQGALPLVQKAIASMYSCLGDREKMVTSWRALADNPGATYAESVEAEILAQYFDSRPASESLDVVRVSFEIDDVGELIDNLDQHPRAVNAGPVQFENEDGPPPKAVFVLLDRDELAAFENVQLNDVPQIAGNLMVFAKQTDKNPRVELYCVRDKKFDATVQNVREMLAAHHSGDEQTEVLEEVLIADHEMSFDWHLPRDVAIERRRELMDQKTRQLVLEKWTQIPFTVLDNQSAEQVAGQQKYLAALASLVQRLEHHFESQRAPDGLIDELKQKLQIPNESLIDPNEENPYELSAIRQRYLDFRKLDDDQLEAIFTHAMMIGNYTVLRKLIPELLNRPDLDREVSFPQALTVLARITFDNDQALDFVKQARTLAVEKGDALGKYLAIELDIRLERGISENCEQLVRTIQGKHMNEPNVEMMLVQTLSRHGLINTDGRPMEPAEMGEPEPAVAAEAAAGIWTPEGDDTREGGSGESKLWLPGSE